MSSSGPKGVVRRKAVHQTSSSEDGGSPLGGMMHISSDSTGLKLSPTAVMVMSISFIVIVLILHIIGKITGSTSARPAEM